MTNQSRQSAINIATANLRRCYRPQGIVAGTHHFTDYWARDGYFAALGSLSIDDKAIVDKLINTFFSYQRQDGLIPYRLMNGPITLGKYFGRPSYYPSPKPTYRLRGFGSEVLDGTTLTLLFSALLKTSKYLPKIKLSLKYLLHREKEGLLWDGPMCEWNDIVWKNGHLLYSNIIYWYMYDRLANWSKSFDQPWSTELTAKKSQIARTLRKILWTGEFFADWHNTKRQDYFYPFGNLLAIVWGFTTQAETNSILKACLSSQINFTLETNTPKYPWYLIDPLQRILGMADYQNHGILWWQTVATYLKALKITNNTPLLHKVEDAIVNKINTDQVIYECYERNGQPVKRVVYASEQPFAWSAGLILWSLSS